MMAEVDFLGLLAGFVAWALSLCLNWVDISKSLSVWYGDKSKSEMWYDSHDSFVVPSYVTILPLLDQLQDPPIQLSVL